MKKIAVMGSGEGKNFEAIVKYFVSNKSNLDVDITCLSDNLNAKILDIAKNLNVKHRYLPFEENGEYFSSHDFDLIILDYYSKELSVNILELGKFINIHPSLLPAFKGKDAISRAFAAGVKVSGITIHSMTNELNGGRIIAQFPVLIGNATHFDEFESEIHNLENRIYPIVIEKILEDKVFDFSDLIGNSNCTGCSSCSGCS